MKILEWSPMHFVQARCWKQLNLQNPGCKGIHQSPLRFWISIPGKSLPENHFWQPPASNAWLNQPEDHPVQMYWHPEPLRHYLPREIDLPRQFQNKDRRLWYLLPKSSLNLNLRKQQLHCRKVLDWLGLQGLMPDRKIVYLPMNWGKDWDILYYQLPGNQYRCHNFYCG